MASIGQKRFFYMNGVANTDGSGSKATKRVQTIVQGSSGYAGERVSVTFHPNDSAPKERIIADAVLGVLGLALVIYAIERESKGKANTSTRVAGVAGGVMAVLAASDYVQIQKDKNEIASKFAGRIAEFLGEDNSNVAVLVLHSQGADIGYRALQCLTLYKENIEVITIGPMVTIPNTLASKVTNYQLSGDLVSRVVAAPFELTRRYLDGNAEREIVQLSAGGQVAHSTGVYLEQPEVRKKIQRLV